MSQPFAFTFRDRLYATWDKAQSALIEQLDQLYAQLSLLPDTAATSANGTWVNVPFDASAFQIAGAGNSWTVAPPVPGNTFYAISYTMVGTTSMWLNVTVKNSSLTASGTPTNTLTINLPPSFRVAGPVPVATYIGRQHTAQGQAVNGGVAQGAMFFGKPGRTSLDVQLVSAANFADDVGAFTVWGQVLLEVTAV